jgi:hypothetical protein
VRVSRREREAGRLEKMAAGEVHAVD